MTPRRALDALRPFLPLLAPIAIVASLVGIRALADEVSLSNPAVPEATPVQVGDAGPAVLAAAEVDAGAPIIGPDAPLAAKASVRFDGKASSINALAPYPDAEDLLAHAELGDDGRYYATREGQKVPLTLDADLQGRIQHLLGTYAPPFAAVAAIEPSTGRVLALAQYSKDQPGVRGLGLRAAYPAASVFKLVTASALLEKGVDPDKEVCFHGGKHRIQKKLLDSSPRDNRCLDMGDAMAHSANVVFAKLAHQHLTPDELRDEAGKLGFNRPLRFDQPVEKSSAHIPDGSFEFATTAAGFGEVFLSPLHGALLAATMGNRGEMPEPFLIDSGEAPVRHRVLDAKVADSIADMMARTVSVGTARRSFHERGRAVMKDIEVCGKTGSLDDRHPFHDYTWFVGFAPKDHPTIAVAVVVVNDLVWRIRAPYIARESLRYFLQPDGVHRTQVKKSLQARR